MIKVILFDFGGVIGPNANDWKNSFTKIFALSGLDYNKIQELFNLHWVNLRTGNGKMSDFWNDVASNSPNKITV